MGWITLLALLAVVYSTCGQSFTVDQILTEVFEPTPNHRRVVAPTQNTRSRGRSRSNNTELDDLFSEIFSPTTTRTTAHTFASTTHRSWNKQNPELDILFKEMFTSTPAYMNFEATSPTPAQKTEDLGTSLLDIFAPSLTKPTVTTRKPEEENTGCGIRNVDEMKVRIQGITDTKSDYGEFPWMVAVMVKQMVMGVLTDVYSCGGSLIHEKVILTAAHRIYDKSASSLIARAGDWNIQNDDELYKAENRAIVEVIVHENFSSVSLINNIALLITASPFPMNVPTIGTVCLPPPDHRFVGTLCTLSGWGKNQTGVMGKYSGVLNKVDLPVISNEDCQIKFRQTRLGPRFSLHSTFLCADEIGQGACFGDGGSPLVCPFDNGRYYQAGAVAGGIECGVYPGVYTNITVLRAWIVDQMTANGFGTASFTYNAS